MDSLLASLEIPAEFAHHDRLAEEPLISQLQAWRTAAEHRLASLHALVLSEHALALPQRAAVASAVAPFDSDAPWSSPGAAHLAHDILARTAPDAPLLAHILTHTVKPLFRAAPHPALHLATGRALPRPAGGPHAAQDFYDAQPWKARPGAPALVRWCARVCPADAYEALWPLLVPPLMTLLDDYEVPYKLVGAEAAAAMLAAVPPALLARTGVGALLLASLRGALHHLEHPRAPALLRAALPAALLLVQRTQPRGSAAHFDQLCALLGDGIVGGVWLYAAENADVLRAAADALPPVLRALGIGCARYLKALVPQLVHPLLPRPAAAPDPALQLSALRALDAVIDVCAVRMGRWRGTIVDALARCWAARRDAGAADAELDGALRSTAAHLAAACPAVQAEFAQLLAADAGMFRGLVGREPGAG